MLRNREPLEAVRPLQPMPHRRPQLILMAVVMLLIAIAVVVTHVARAATPPVAERITIIAPEVVLIGEYSRVMARVDQDGRVAVDWREVDRIMAEKDNPRVPLYLKLNAYLLAAVRDGTWEVLDQ